MSYGTILSKKLSSTSICKKNCIEGELKNLHNFNPDEEVAKFAKKNSYGTTISKKVVQNVNMQRVRQVAKAQF